MLSSQKAREECFIGFSSELQTEFKFIYWSCEERENHPPKSRNIWTKRWRRVGGRNV